VEGALGVGVAIVAIVALGLAIAAIVLLVRPRGGSGDWPSTRIRTAELERRLAQLGQRLEIVESEADLRASAEGPQRPAAGTVRTTGVALSHVGLVRFDAFGDTGGAQSFALALIDDDGDGVVLTSLHSRQSTRLYIKGVRRGVADAPLSAEEVRAMQHAGVAPTL
jgi:hypothetical protein